MLVLSLFSDRVEQFLRILRLPCELLLLPAGCLGFLHAAKFLGGVFQSQVSVSVEGNDDLMALEINAVLGQSAKLGDPQSGMKQDVDPVIVAAEVLVTLFHYSICEETNTILQKVSAKYDEIKRKKEMN